LFWPAGAKKKVGVGQEEVAQVILASAWFGPSDPLANETSLSPPQAAINRSQNLKILNFRHRM
jgi:hypothetical protein